MTRPFRDFLLVFLLWIFILQQTCICCPTNCKCRGKATKCGSGLTSFPSGLDATTEFLGISGIASQPNTISTIHKGDFAQVTPLFSLSLTFDGIQHLEDEAFSYLANLHLLNLANNDIQQLPADSFKGLSDLVSLDLSGNRNCTFNKTAFTYLGNLEHLNLGDMNLKVIQTGLFGFVPKLKKLLLYMNGISRLPTNVISPLRSLEYLDISSNRLLGLQVELKPFFLMVGHLKLEENPWQCNCQLLWFRDLPGDAIHGVTDSKEVVCNGPTNLRYMSFSSVPDNMLICVPIEIKGCENVSHALKENETISLSCGFEGDPEPEVKWTRPDGYNIDGRGTVDGNYEISNNGTFLINHVSALDNGEWIVTAYNKTNQEEKRIQIHVISFSTPWLTSPSTPKKISTASSSSKKSDAPVVSKKPPAVRKEVPRSNSPSLARYACSNQIIVLIVSCVWGINLNQRLKSGTETL